MKARVSKNLKGTLVLSTISSQALQRNQEFDLDMEQYWKDDVQDALRKKYVVITKGEPRAIPTVEVIKTTNGSVTLPVVKKVLRDDKPFKIRAELLDHQEFRKLIKNNKIAVVGKSNKATVVPRNQPEASEEKVARDVSDIAAKKTGDSVVWDAQVKANAEHAAAEQLEQPVKRKRGRPRKNATTNVKKVGESLIIDPDSDANDDKDGIMWVDTEQSEERVKNHPILGKKRPLDM